MRQEQSTIDHQFALGLMPFVIDVMMQWSVVIVWCDFFPCRDFLIAFLAWKKFISFLRWTIILHFCKIKNCIVFFSPITLHRVKMKYADKYVQWRMKKLERHVNAHICDIDTRRHGINTASLCVSMMYWYWYSYAYKHIHCDYTTTHTLDTFSYLPRCFRHFSMCVLETKHQRIFGRNDLLNSDNK